MGYLTLIWVIFFTMALRGSYLGNMNMIWVKPLCSGTKRVIYGSYDFDMSFISFLYDREDHIWVI